MPWDAGPETIDVSGYPAEMQAVYRTEFSVLCARCHTLARPINAPNATPEEWRRYIRTMMRKAGSGIAPSSAEEIFRFLVYDSSVRKRSLLDAKRAEAAAGEAEFPFILGAECPDGAVGAEAFDPAEPARLLRAYRFDPRGRRFGLARFGPDGLLEKTLVADTPVDGRPAVWARWYSPARTLLEQWEPERDPEGRLTGAVAYSADLDVLARASVSSGEEAGSVALRELGPDGALRSARVFTVERDDAGRAHAKTEYEVRRAGSRKERVAVRVWRCAFP